MTVLDAIYLPKLTRLTPSLSSTILKAMEEAGELARAVLKFLPYDSEGRREIPAGSRQEKLLLDVAEELLDVAQTCVTMIFVMEDSHGIHPEELIELHLRKLDGKGYRYDHSRSYRIVAWNNGGNDDSGLCSQASYKLIHLPRLDLPDVTLLTTVCKIQEELGELSQFIGKGARASGEQSGFSQAQVDEGCALELLDVAQCCFTMMYILAERYAVDMPALVAAHREKLSRKGYC